MNYMTEAVRQWARAEGSEQPLRQWILSDYDTWERNPFYIGPDLGHPEIDEPLGAVYASFDEASKQAKHNTSAYGITCRLENYKDRCWVVWYQFPGDAK